MTDSDQAAGLWKGVQGTALVLVVGFFLYSLRGILNPFYLFWLLVALLYPFRGRQGYSLLLGAATVLLLLWILDATGSVLAPFVLAFVLAYILDPVVDRVSSHPRISRSLAIVLILGPVLLGGAALVVVGVPILASQLSDLIESVPALVDRLEGWARALSPETLGIDVPFVDEEALLARIQSVDGQAVMEFLEERRDEIGARAWSAVLGLGRGLGTLLTVLGYVVLTPVLMFYLLRDYDLIIERLGELVPAQHRDDAEDFFGEYDRLLSQYLRGQVSVAAIVGAITWIGLLVLGFPYSFLLGVTVAVLGVVPYLGLALSLIPAVVIALVSGNVAWSLGKLAIVFGLAQGLEGTVISPRIVGESVGLHPVWIVLALSLGGFLFGFVGLLIGVPLAVGVKLAVVRLLDRYKRTDFYRRGPELSA